MDASKRVVRFNYFDTKMALIKFWIVMIIVDIGVYLLSLYKSESISIGISDGGSYSLVLMNIMPILIYLIVYSYEMYYVSFPIAISFSATRKDFFKSLILDNILVASILALVQGIFIKMDPILVKSMGRKPIYDLGFFNIQTDNLLFIIFSLFIIFLFLLSIWNLLAAFNYRFGYKMWIVAGIVALLTISLDRYDFIAKIVDIYSGLVISMNKFLLFSTEMFVIIISYSLGYSLIKKLSIKK